MSTLQGKMQVADERLAKKLDIICQEQPERKPDDITAYEWDERGMAELFALTYQDECRYCAEAKSWYTYTDGVWKKDDSALFVMGKLTEFSRLMTLYSASIENEELRNSYTKECVNRLGDRRYRERIVKDASNNELLLISATRFDENPYLLNMQNGTYNLQTGEWHEHTPADLLTLQTNCSYSTMNKSRCEKWEKFIDEIMVGDEVKKHYLQKCLGYSLLGVAREECFFICYGSTTRNGKSTLLNTICHLLGAYADVSPVSIICKSTVKNAEAANPMIATLKGKRFITMAESNQYGKLDEEAIKQLTGGEEIKARNLYEKPITFLPQMSMWLSTNSLPMVQDKSIFASDRVIVLTFDRHFSHQEQDKTLKSYFCQPDSMRGIMQWLIDGYNMYVAEGLEMPTEVQKTVNQYARENDLVLQFLEDKCEKDPTRGIRAKELYDVYKDWCKDNNSYTCTSRKFNSEMDAHCEWYEQKKVVRGYTYFTGIKFRGD